MQQHGARTWTSRFHLCSQDGGGGGGVHDDPCEVPHAPDSWFISSDGGSPIGDFRGRAGGGESGGDI